jgi:MoaA/NifB/PqqE/SkfB family radical SAM enzyme
MTQILRGRCGKCGYKKICGGGCRIRAYFQYGDLWAEDPLCPYTSTTLRLANSTFKKGALSL